MHEWLAQIARLAAAAEAGIDRAKHGAEERFLPPRVLRAIPYRSYGAAGALWVRGRVLRDAALPASRELDGAWDNLLATWRRFESDEVPGAIVRLTLGDATRETATDGEGYFSATLEPATPLPLDRPWHDVRVEVVSPVAAQGPAIATAAVLVPPHSATHLIVSDIDDTVVRTEATQLVRMARQLLFGNARTRLPFPGVAAFYRALVAGRGGSAGNPVFYVSSSPWNLYELLDELFTLRGIPPGPLLLRDWGLTAEELLPTKHAGHKLAAIRGVLEAYPSLPCILIGDSGQEDPEIYAQVIRDFPGRVLAAYIRDVHPEDARRQAVHALADALAAEGATLLLTKDTIAAAQHAARQGWIVDAALASIAADEAIDKG